MKNKEILAAVIVILLLIPIILSFKMNVLDSDSGREIQRAKDFIKSGEVDSGPLVSEIIYAILLLFNQANLIFSIKILNVIMFLMTILVCTKILDSFKVKNYQKFLFIILFLSPLSIFFLIFYYKSYLLVTFFLSISILYLCKYYIKNENKYLVLSSIFLATSTLIKNHAYPFLALPIIIFLINSIIKRKLQLKNLLLVIIPFIIILGPYLLVNIIKFGIRFWHFPNTYYFEGGINDYIAKNFWHYPVGGTIQYFIGQMEFLFASIPFLFLIILCFIYSLKYSKKSFKIFIPLIILSALPFLIGIIPFYQQYNYLLSLIIILFICLELDFIFNKTTSKIILCFSIVVLSIFLISGNIVKVLEIDKDSKAVLIDLKKFEDNINKEKNIKIISRDFKLSSYSNKNIDIWGIEDLDKDEIVNILSSNQSEKELYNSLNKEKIDFILFYKDKRYNEDFYSKVMDFFNLNFNMKKFENSKVLEKAYEGDTIIVYKVVPQ